MSFLAQTLAGAARPQAPHHLPNGVTVTVLDEGIIRFDPPGEPAERAQDVVISAGVHGNETAPVELVDALITRILAGTLTPRVRVLMLFGNVAALRTGQRFVAQDMNRLFCRQPEAGDGAECRRAAQLEGHVMGFFARAMQDGVPRLHYDLHTAIHGSLIEKFAIYPMPPSGRGFRRSEIKRLALGGIDAVLLQGTRAPTFSFFSSNHCGAEAFTIELGSARPFGQNDGIDLSLMATLLEDLITGSTPRTPERAVQVYRVGRQVIKTSDAFRLAIDSKTDNFTPLPHGSVIAVDGDSEITVTEHDAVIIFPNQNVAIGQRAGLIAVPAELDE
ncbi:succinylglutamate desuccinylase [Chitinibacteraceae bacterium HSL-7]